MLKLTRIPVVIALGIGLAFAGCGDDDDEDSGSAATTAAPAQAAAPLTLAADASAFKYDKTSLTAPAGTVEIVMDNPSDKPHNVAIDGGGVDAKGPVVEKDGKSTVSADLKAGTYKFYCSVGEHRAGGMEGTLTVE